jgi:tetratricopeptide (TPR) repeat protein
MKKQLILVSVASLLSVATMAQKTEMTTAIMSYDSFQKAQMRGDFSNAKPLLTKAKEKIDEAHQKQTETNALKQKDIAKLYYNRFMIYLNYATLAAFDAEVAKQLEAESDSFEQAIKSSYETLSKNDPKKEYLEQLYAFIGMQRAQAVNMGIEMYNKGDYENSFMMFQGAAEMYEMINQSDSLSYYNGGLAAQKLKKYDEALTFFQKAADVKYEGVIPHLQIINTLKEMDADKEKVLTAIKAARTSYPEDYGLLIEELNYYLSSDNNPEAEKMLKVAIDKNPNDHVLHFTIGTVYDKMLSNNVTIEIGMNKSQVIDLIGMPDSELPKTTAENIVLEHYNYGKSTITFENNKVSIINGSTSFIKKEKNTAEKSNELFLKAEESYMNAIKIKEDYIDAQYSLGALYVNQSTDLKQRAADEKDRKKYDAAFEMANEMMKKAIAPLERAYAINPEDKDAKSILNVLKSIYVQFEMMDDYNRVKALIDKK